MITTKTSGSIKVEKTPKNWAAMCHKLGKEFEKRAHTHDVEGSFVSTNYDELKEEGFFSALVPSELGGGGMSHTEMANCLRIIAQYCGSTALALSMHQHLVAATVYKYIHKGEGQATLEKVVSNQIVLVSTGARDWLGSNGELKPTEGGYLFSAQKHFASQSAVGNVAVTSAPLIAEDGTWKVLHFPVALNASGVSLKNDWNVMGMRGTGSQAIVFENVFIPKNAIALQRDRDAYHPVWNLVLSIAMPLIMSCYVGMAEKAFELALNKAKKMRDEKSHIPAMIGKLNNQLVAAQAQYKAMVNITDNFQFKLDKDNSIEMLSLKTNVVDACQTLVREAMEVAGGASFYKGNTLERIFRDMQAANFHPLAKWDQFNFTGNRLLVM